MRLSYNSRCGFVFIHYNSLLVKDLFCSYVKIVAVNHDCKKPYFGIQGQFKTESRENPIFSRWVVSGRFNNVWELHREKAPEGGS